MIWDVMWTAYKLFCDLHVRKLGQRLLKVNIK